MFKARRSPEKRKHLAGLVRVLAYMSGVGIVCGALSIRAARAEVANQSLVVGRQMMELTNAQQNDITNVTLNGQSMFVGSSLSQEPVDDILNRYEKHCRENQAQSPDAWRAVGAKDGKVTVDTIGGDFNSGVLRAGDEREGTVVCFVRSSQSKASVTEALKALNDTGELGAIGSLRYVYAKKTKKGNTHILTGWTLDKFNIGQFMPEEDKDVPGSDFAELPRPESSHRVLSARVEGTPFGMNVYRSDQAPDKVAADFDAQLSKKGWFALDTEISQHEDTSVNKGVGHLYEKDGVVLTLASTIQEGKTITALGLAGVQTEANNR
jgi:hypothetical protein